MERISLQSVVDVNLEAVRSTARGHSATTVHGGAGRRLRHSVLALAAGAQMAEHASPAESTLLVLDGKVRVDAGNRSAELGSGDLLALPTGRHSVVAIEDSALLLTVALA